jgi:hypothetical protein
VEEARAFHARASFRDGWKLMKALATKAVITTITAGIITAGWLSAAPASAQDAAPRLDAPAFSATQVLHSSRYDIEMKVYHADTGVRAQYNPALARVFVPGNRKVYNLTRYPDGSSTCVASPLADGMGLPNLLELFYYPLVKRTPAGTEVIEGHSTRVERRVIAQGDRRTEVKVWLADDLQGAPVKIEANFEGVGFTALYRDITLGAPDKGLFTLPARCIPVDKMGQVAEHKVYK